ncbi:MAG: hypothetical protein A2231_07960 [Candidatus Firestonebacteria bacterium RIFOXYA2_FULL_40_8]|nr:MAG: hypothetical protein A2231_07960 [Candidatus Firestonebacteria bacterium RIFOXYA2_FULL_40_8]
MNKNTALLLHPSVSGKIRDEKIKEASRYKTHKIHVKTCKKEGNNISDWIKAEKQILLEFEKLYIYLNL